MSPGRARSRQVTRVAGLLYLRLLSKLLRCRDFLPSANSRPEHLQQNPCEGDYSMTSSARASNVGGIVRPSALAVLRLMASSNVVGCCTGRSAGLAPVKILCT